ncbi:glycosyltransferase family 4 protein (plasmid) [Salipiger sp. H15]|uniref:Glycosyltransferase family 4 protein n=1 Tax=Alloyangia sp. H15 TaxID=3029062 RepID=A0AAU8AT42_9RHOB
MAAPDRIVLLNDFSRAEGGAGYLATTLAAGLSARGLRVTFIAGDTIEQGLPEGVEPVAIGGHALLDGPARSAALRGLDNRTAAAAVGRWISENDTPGTVYHLHNWSNIFSPSVFDALAPVRDRLVIHAHDFFLACPNGAYLDFQRDEICGRTPLSTGCIAVNCDKRSYSHKLWRAARQGVLQRKLRPHLPFARFVTIHEATVPLLRRAITPAHMHVIRNPVTAFASPVPAPEAQRRFVHIGRIQKLKGVFEIAAAGERLGLRIDFFGGGEDLDEMVRRHPSHAYHGWTDRDTIGKAMQTVRAVIVGTKSPEPFCLAAFEAAATGLPLILSDAILAAPELAGTGAAIMFRAGDADALAAVIGRVRDDDALVARLARAARDTRESLGHGLPDWIEAHLRLYTQLARPAGRHTDTQVARAAG